MNNKGAEFGIDYRTPYFSREKAEGFVQRFITKEQKAIGSRVIPDTSTAVEHALSRVLCRTAKSDDLELLQRGYQKSSVWNLIHKIHTGIGNGYDKEELNEQLNFVRVCNQILHFSESPESEEFED
ncbi:MAG: hypothetical protein V1858_02965 [Candidatus Gottesmanbacteria bacterium]